MKIIIAKEEKFYDDQIEEYRLYLRLVRQFHNKLYKTKENENK